MPTLLVITVLLPLLGSLALMLAPRLDRTLARSIALGCTLITMALSLVLLLWFRTGHLAPQFAFGPTNGPYGLQWLTRPDIRFALGLDGLSLWLFLLTALLMITAVLSSWESISERAPCTTPSCSRSRPVCWGCSQVSMWYFSTYSSSSR